jgi:SPP1 gp7 family putative phage head morphogenesis protein
VIDALTRHQLFVQRLAGGNWNTVRPIFERLEQQIFNAVGRSDFQNARLAFLRSDVYAAMATGCDAAQAMLTPALEEFSAYEAQFTQRVLDGAVTVQTAGAAPEGLTAVMQSTPMQLGPGKPVLVNDMFRGFADSVASQVEDRVWQGILSGDPTPKIARDVRAMVKGRTRRQAEAIVRTATNHVGNQARAEVYRANADIIREEQIVATLDGRTTPVCRSRDGQRYPVGQGPVPPFHYNCRTVRVPVLDSRFAALSRDRTRAGMDGPVSAGLSYGDWLARQPKAFQNEVLGPGRASIFRAGKLPLSKFVDASGRELTLSQLRALEAVTI